MNISTLTSSLYFLKNDSPDDYYEQDLYNERDLKEISQGTTKEEDISRYIKISKDYDISI